MKHLCFSKILFFLLLCVVPTFASLEDKSAVIYYGKNISYPMVGIHDYIVVKPNNIDQYRHGFSLYKDKMYARVDLCKEQSILEKEIESLLKKGFVNIYFDASSSDCSFENFDKKIYYFYSKYSFSKIMINVKIPLSERVLGITYVVVTEESLENKLELLQKIQEYDLDIIYLKFVRAENLKNMDVDIEEMHQQGVIPYITNNNFDIYGLSSKKAIKREILTLVDASMSDRMFLSAHKYGAVVFEYLGYIQKLYDVNGGLPDPNKLQQYAGVVIWLNRNYHSPDKFMEWISALKKQDIKFVFVNNFGTAFNTLQVNQLGIKIYNGINDAKKKIIQTTPLIPYEVEPSLSDESFFLQPLNSEALLTYEDKNGLYSVPSAITPWGGYAMREAFMLELDGEYLWVINPFKFFQKALRLKKLLVPDTTTENGRRLLFTHIDGDGIANYVESNSQFFAGDMILNNILKKYSIPHSVSILGADVVSDGFYKKVAPRLQHLMKKIYSLDNVEPATHTFSHPLIWSKIRNGSLDEKYRLQLKGYEFSLESEIEGSLEYINRKFLPKRKAISLFWSGDYAPRGDVLAYLYKHHILNINGGSTSISNVHPWLSYVAPLGLEREGYYQVYSASNSDNFYTKNWLGPLWGFKNVQQTFELTNRPKRLKPIDIYYHFYSGSKIASLNALESIFDWAIEQDVMPIYTSEYILKVMDYFTVSMAYSKGEWLVDGMVNLKTLRDEGHRRSIDLQHSKTLLGKREMQNCTYISLDQKRRHYIFEGDESKSSFLVSSNAKVVAYRDGVHIKSYHLKGNVKVSLLLHLEDSCEVDAKPKYKTKKKVGDNLMINFENREVVVNVLCR